MLSDKYKKTFLPSGRAKAILASLVLLVVVILLFVSRFHFLDDAFIHLRIAHSLVDNGYYSFNGDEPQFASSSPLYTALLSACSFISRTPMLPKLVNIPIYLLLLALPLRALLRTHSRSQGLLLIASFMIVASPLCVRWMTDGMETGLIAIVAVLLAATTQCMSTDRSPGILLSIATSALCVLAVVLRVEFGYVLALALAAISLRCLGSVGTWREAQPALMRAVARCLPHAVGGLVGAGLVILLFGHLLPDTALAKQAQSTSIEIVKTLTTILRAHLGSSLFGAGMLALWSISALLVLRATHGGERRALLAVNAGVPVFIVLLIVTQQAIQGMRYFVFLEFFVVSVNILSLPRSGSPLRFGLPVCIGVAAMCLWFAFDAVLFHKIVKGRSDTYQRFVQGNYDYLAGRRGVAWDIGMVGFFTKGFIFDMHGLANGRYIARLTLEERLQRMAGESVDFVFANSDQLTDFNRYVDTANWETVGRFDFPNASGRPDTHNLIVRPTASDTTSSSSESVGDGGMIVDVDK